MIWKTVLTNLNKPYEAERFTGQYFVLKWLMSSLFLLQSGELYSRGVITQFWLHYSVTEDQTSSGSHIVWHVQLSGHTVKICQFSPSCVTNVRKGFEGGWLNLAVASYQRVCAHKGRECKTTDKAFCIKTCKRELKCLNCRGVFGTHGLYSNHKWDVFLVVVLLWHKCFQTVNVLSFGTHFIVKLRRETREKREESFGTRTDLSLEFYGVLRIYVAFETVNYI